jgi:exodeoxyribonuclease V beta subunit
VRPEDTALAAFDPWTTPLEGITLIEASAGTGKTWNITEIFLRLLLDDQREIREILVVTFTEAATTELRERIRRGIRGRLEAALAPGNTDSEDTRLALRAALAGFDEASIFTIHGFCQRVLQQFAFESGAPAELTLATDAGALREEVAQDFYTRATHALPMPVFAALSATGFTPGDVLTLARKLGEGPLLGVPAVGSDQLTFEAAGERLQATFEATAAAWATEGQAARQALLAAVAAQQLNARAYKRDKVEALFDALEAYLTTGEAGSDLDEALYLLGVEGLEEKGRKKNTPLPSHPFFAAVDALRAAFEGMRAGSLSLLQSALTWIPAELARRKAAQQTVDFGDLLSGVAEALVDPERGPRLKAALRKRYAWALIDEFQDTDPLQWTIFRGLFDRLYLIGDPKQAIYGFRGADLPTYLGARDHAQRRYGLMRNFRTDAALVAAVNRVFDRPELERPFVDERIRYASVGAAHPGPRLRRRASQEGAAPLVFRTLGREGAQIEKRAPFTVLATFVRERLPGIVAADIADLLSGDWEISVPVLAGQPPRWRPLQPRDVSVLVRRNAEAADMKAALTQVGVPAVLQGTGSVFATEEAADLRQVMACLGEPTTLPLLRAALATPLLGVAAEDIAGLTAAPVPGAAEQPAFVVWTERFRRWHAEWNGRGFMVAFRALLGECGLLERLLGEIGGERRTTNLMHLAELLHAAERAQALRPHALLAWFDRQLSEDEGTRDEERQLRLESDADALQIVTMHSSKGLEYGVVFLPYLWAAGGLHPAEAAHPRYPLDVAADAPPGTPRTAVYLTGDDVVRAEAAARAEVVAQQENLRLLYVALTRARHQCIVYWGAVHNAGKSPLAYVLHPAPAGAERPLESVARAFADLTDTQLAGDLAPLGIVAPVDWAAPVERAYSPPEAPDVGVALRPFPKGRDLDAAWRRASFTGLTRGASHPGVAEGREFDEVEEVSRFGGGAGGPDAEGAADALLGQTTTLDALPPGRATGLGLHRALERLDFPNAGPAEIEAAARPALRAYGLAFERHGANVCRALAEILDTPLLADDTTLTLRSLSRARRVPELSFDLAVARGDAAGPISARRLGAVLAQRKELGDYGDRLAALDFAPFSGFLTGALDLAFEHGGRYWLLDYKSNRLGPTYAHYAPERLAQVMSESHYHLQSHLYAAALHLHLRQRLGAAYVPETHFGGCLFLFMRGLHPELKPAQGGRMGVYRDRPPTEILDALCDALGVP